MKKCPECHREYFDEMLNYCLDDGASLLHGPAAAEEPATAILHTTDVAGDGPTRAQLHTTDATALLSGSSHSADPGAVARRNWLLPAVLGIILTAAVGTGALYFSGRWSSSQIGSIAVMPFVNESGSADFDYLSDGMTETLINSLSELPQLSVKARSLVFRYKGKDVDPKQVATELGVQAVLNGRFVRRGENIALSLDLFDANTGNQIWGENYERKFADILTLEKEIARDVSNKLKTKLSGADEQTLAKSYTVDPEAYQLYLQGRFQWNKRTPEAVRKAADYFQAAIDKDPNYALAYVGLADSHIVGEGFTAYEANPKAKAAALKALTLDPSLGEAHAVLGNVAMYYEWDWVTAEREYKRAIELNPNYATAHHWYGESLSAVGRFDESFAEYARALALDPVSLPISSDLGIAYAHARQSDQAIAHLKKLAEVDPSFVRTYFYLASVYEDREMFNEAIEARTRGLLLAGRNPEKVSNAMKRLSDALTRSGPKGYWQTALEQAFTRSEGNDEPLDPIEIAFLYAKLGEKDKAFEWLERGFRARLSAMVFLKSDSGWNDLKSDPRFVDLMRRVGLPE
ncbi:MAG: tetratricopeptide repeat protein [Pyrinomonadaceae bacterium]